MRISKVDASTVKREYRGEKIAVAIVTAIDSQKELALQIQLQLYLPRRNKITKSLISELNCQLKTKIKSYFAG
jgi:hypothetical protein